MDIIPSTVPTVDADEFLAAVLPALKACDAAALARAAKARWKPSELCGLLRHPNVDVRRVAAVVIGLVGNAANVHCLTQALSDTDRQVNQMAEHSLWSIWFRGGSPEAARPFREGLSHLSADQYEQAIEKLTEAAEIDPHFAEAYNQLGIAHFLAGNYDKSIQACRRAIQLVPMHFGAIAGMGHCFAQLGELNLALRCYRRARRINPQLEGINQAIDRLQTKIKDMSDSGEFMVESIVH